LAASGSLVFTPSTTQRTFEVEIIGDAEVESDEIFRVALSNPQGAVLDQSGTVIKGFEALHTILDDDNKTTVNPTFATQGDTFQANTFELYDQLNPAVAGLGNAMFVVVWESRVQDGSLGGIYAQMFASNGEAVGEEFQVNTSSEYNQIYPAVTSLSDGGFIVAWQSIAPDSGVFAQRYFSDGTRNGDEIELLPFGSSSQRPPAIEGLENGGYVVVSPTPEIMLQIYSNDNLPLGPIFQANTQSFDSQVQPTIGTLLDGSFVVTWTSRDQDGSDWGIFGKIFDSTGLPISDEFQINSYWENMQYGGDVAVLSNGDFVVTWSSRSQDGDGWGIYRQRFDSSGERVGGEGLVNTTISGDQIYPSITDLDTGGYIIMWNSRHELAATYLYAQAFNEDETRLGGEYRVNPPNTTNNVFADISDSDENGFMAVWTTEFFSNGGGRDIFGQIFTLDTSVGTSTASFASTLGEETSSVYLAGVDLTDVTHTYETL
jgi:hypothetical protein